MTAQNPRSRRLKGILAANSPLLESLLFRDEDLAMTMPRSPSLLCSQVSPGRSCPGPSKAPIAASLTSPPHPLPGLHRFPEMLGLREDAARRSQKVTPRGQSPDIKYLEGEENIHDLGHSFPLLFWKRTSPLIHVSFPQYILCPASA